MGTWGMQTFDNDGTSDWLWELEEVDDTSVLEAALNPQESDYLEAPDGEIILAAAEIICGILHGPRAGLPDEALAWIEGHKTLNVAPLKPRALAMVERVLAAKSELRELWEENDADLPAWLENVGELRDKLAR